MKKKKKEPLDSIFGDRMKLLECLKSIKAKVGVVLKNGGLFEGVLVRVDEDKIRIKTRKDGEFYGTFIDTWPWKVAAIMFAVPEDYSELPFAPYQEKQPRYYDFHLLRSPEHALISDVYELLGYFLEGKRQKIVPYVTVVLDGGKRFEGALELVNENRILLKLKGSKSKKNIFLDFHPAMVSAVEMVITDKGWPYDPTAS